MEIPQDWTDRVSEIKTDPSIRRIYVIGETATGKTTFCRYLYRRLLGGYRIGYLDCDPGQSVIGPPTTVGLHIHVPAAGGERDSFSYWRFVGDTTPSRHLLQTAGGIKRLSDKAQERDVEKLVIDSSGFVGDKTAREFQFNVIDIIQPDYILAFRRGYSVPLILNNFRKNTEIKIETLSVPAAAVSKSPEKRKAYRQDKFRCYFRNMTEGKLKISDYGIHGMIPDLRISENWKDLIFALCDREQIVVSLGVISNFDGQEKTVTFVSPPFEPERVTSIQFGSLRLTPECVPVPTR